MSTTGATYRLTRRRFVQGADVAGLGLLAGCGQLPWQAQQPPRVYRSALFHVGTDHIPPALQPLRDELRTLGYMDGHNVQLHWRNLEDEEAARDAAREFAQDRMDLIVAFDNQTARAAQAATSEIPVVFVHVDDPVGQGLVASLAHPGGNLTGFVTFEASPAKWLELLRDIGPQIQRVLTLVDPLDPLTARVLAEARPAGATLDLELVERAVASDTDVQRVFGAIQPGDVDAVVVLSPNLRSKFTALVLRLASERRLPLVTHQREWVQQGALCSYAPDVAWAGVPAAHYMDRILKGTKPWELPVDQAMRFELVVNLAAAQALGLSIPQHVLLQATEIIQ